MTKLIDYSHLDKPRPGSATNPTYPTRDQGVTYFKDRFIYLREEKVVLDKLTGLEFSQTNFVKEQFNGWQWRQIVKPPPTPETPEPPPQYRYGPLAKAWVDSDRVYKRKKVYVPGKHQEEVPDCWNTWPGWPYEPEAGDVSLWVALLDHMFEGLPSWEREYFEFWIAYQIQHPGSKLFFAVLMSGASGIGKGTVLRVLEALFGANAHGINEQELSSRFTSSVVDKQLVIGDEIGSREGDRHQVARRMKSWITEPKLLVERKNKDVIEIDNRVNFIFATNDPNPFVQDDDDRRFFDLRFEQTQKIDGSPNGTGLAKPFFDWFGQANQDLTDAQIGARQAMMQYFFDMDLSELKSEDADDRRFDPFSSVPETSSKAAFIERSSSDVVNWLRRLRDNPDEVLSVHGEVLPNVLLSTEDFYRLFQEIEANSDVKKKVFEQELTRCLFFKKALSSRVSTQSAGLKTLWVIRPDRFRAIFNNQIPDHAAVKGLYDSEYSDIRKFIEASQEERKPQ